MMSAGPSQHPRAPGRPMFFRQLAGTDVAPIEDDVARNELVFRTTFRIQQARQPLVGVHLEEALAGPYANLHVADEGAGIIVLGELVNERNVLATGQA